MPEGQPLPEVEPQKPLADAIQDIFERRARHGSRKVILETYQKSLERVIATLPKEKQDTTAIKIQKFLVTIGGALSEYGTRITDFVRNIVVSPMIAWAGTDFPNDKYYQISLARAKAWGEFALNTTKTATGERMTYRDHFLPSVLTGVPVGGLLGSIAAGTLMGAEYGTVAAGAVGAVAGAVGGAAVGAAAVGAESLFFKIKDAILGPPVVYYGLASYTGPPVIVNTVQKISPWMVPPNIT